MNILFSGGGTGGSVTPLVAVKKEIQKRLSETKFFWIGTKHGLEREIVEDEKIVFYPISSGKFRRYLSLKNISDIIWIIHGFFQSLDLINRIKPDKIIVAGGFVAVPVVWAGALLKIPIYLHHQDVHIGLANKLMQKFATKITVGLEESKQNFKSDKVAFTGNPVRPEIFSGNKDNVFNKYNLFRNIPIVLFIGGGTGAQGLNLLIGECLDRLTEFCQVIHLTGKNKLYPALLEKSGKNNRYLVKEFANPEEIADFYQAADLVVSRAGMNVLNELACLAKPAIIIPIPDSHQEDNARYFKDKNAAVVLAQNKLDEKQLINIVKETLNKDISIKLSANINSICKKDALEKIVDIVLSG